MPGLTTPSASMTPQPIHPSSDDARSLERAPRPTDNTPLWMDLDHTHTQTRTGVTAPKNSGLQTIAFFGLITMVVGAAGFLGIAMWGPEKPIKNRTHLATEPPAPTPLPSLPADTPSVAPPVAGDTAPAESSAPAAAASSSAPNQKRAKKAPLRAVGKKH